MVTAVTGLGADQIFEAMCGEQPFTGKFQRFVLGHPALFTPQGIEGPKRTVGRVRGLRGR